ncbi:MAG: ATP-binding protein [Clostridia bacterium]|nr:ATP-binding protein [Clostridia bacterium]
MIKRTQYLNELKRWRDEKLIKVVTGIRRCGKSTLLSQFQALLREEGVASDQIISVNLEALEFESLLNYKALYQYIVERLQPDKKNYIFLDEVQMVADFQKAVDSLYIKENVDIYITGSNAYLLSGELATLLSGRYVEIRMLPLSFKEYCAAKEGMGRERLFAEYMRYGAFPYVAGMEDVQEGADTYLEGIYNTIIIKDIEARYARKSDDPNNRKIADIALLRSIARFLAGSIGSPISVKSIADYITSTGRRVSQNTVSDYLDALKEPYVFYPVERYDVTGRQLLKQNRKFYIVDLGLRRLLVAKREHDLGYSLENVIFLELLRRGYRVYVGKVGATEVDFVAEKGEQRQYFQVSASLVDAAVFEREIRPLRAISDNYPKTILTLDPFSIGNYGGIQVLGAIDWLTKEE